MIIDLILDRKNGQNYTPKKFYTDIMAYGQSFPDIAFPIADALDGGNEQDVKNALSRYISDNEYNENIIDYIQSVDWLASR